MTLRTRTHTHTHKKKGKKKGKKEEGSLYWSDFYPITLGYTFLFLPRQYTRAHTIHNPALIKESSCLCSIILSIHPCSSRSEGLWVKCRTPTWADWGEAAWCGFTVRTRRERGRGGGREGMERKRDATSPHKGEREREPQRDSETESVAMIL